MVLREHLQLSRDELRVAVDGPALVSALEGGSECSGRGPRKRPRLPPHKPGWSAGDFQRRGLKNHLVRLRSPFASERFPLYSCAAVSHVDPFRGRLTVRLFDEKLIRVLGTAEHETSLGYISDRALTLEEERACPELEQLRRLGKRAERRRASGTESLAHPVKCTAAGRLLGDPDLTAPLKALLQTPPRCTALEARWYSWLAGAPEHEAELDDPNMFYTVGTRSYAGWIGEMLSAENGVRSAPELHDVVMVELVEYASDERT